MGGLAYSLRKWSHHLPFPPGLPTPEALDMPYIQSVQALQLENMTFPRETESPRKRSGQGADVSTNAFAERNNAPTASSCGEPVTGG